MKLVLLFAIQLYEFVNGLSRMEILQFLFPFHLPSVGGKVGGGQEKGKSYKTKKHC